MHIVYKTTNKQNGKFYIGVHKAGKKRDSYLGSGKALRLAIAKYGEEAFARETLAEFADPVEAYAYEASLLTQELLQSESCYNMKAGGNGGWRFVHANGLTNKNKDKSHYVKMARAAKVAKEADPEFHQRWLGSLNRSAKSEATKAKISASLSGKKRSKHWVTNGQENIFLDVESSIPPGFRKGRKV